MPPRSVDRFLTMIFAAVAAALCGAVFLLWIVMRTLGPSLAGAGLALAVALWHILRPTVNNTRRWAILTIFGVALLCLAPKLVKAGGIESSSTAEPVAALSVPATAPQSPVPAPTPPPAAPRPPSCAAFCLQHALPGDEWPTSPLWLLCHRAAAEGVTMLLAKGVTMLGPPGSFARNFWPVLVPLGLVTAIAVASLALPWLAPALAPLLRLLSAHRTQLAHLARAATAAAAAAIAVAIVVHAPAGGAAPLLALWRAAPALPLGLLAAQWGGFRAGGLGALTATGEQAARAAFLACVGTAAASFATARGLLAAPPHAAELPPLRKFLCRLSSLAGNGAVSARAPPCDDGRCAAAWVCLCLAAAWAALVLLAEATNSAALRTLAAAPRRAAAATLTALAAAAAAARRVLAPPCAAAAALATAAATVCLRAATACGGAAATTARAVAEMAAAASRAAADAAWRERRALQGLGLSALGLVLLADLDSISAELAELLTPRWPCPSRVPPLCAAAARTIAADVGGPGRLPACRLALALYRAGGACARSTLRAVAGALCASGGTELLARRAALPYARVLLSAPLRARPRPRPPPPAPSSGHTTATRVPSRFVPSRFTHPPAVACPQFAGVGQDRPGAATAARALRPRRRHATAARPLAAPAGAAASPLPDPRPRPSPTSALPLPTPTPDLLTRTPPCFPRRGCRCRPRR